MSRNHGIRMPRYYSLSPLRLFLQSLRSNGTVIKTLNNNSQSLSAAYNIASTITYVVPCEPSISPPTIDLYVTSVTKMIVVLNTPFFHQRNTALCPRGYPHLMKFVTIPITTERDFSTQELKVFQPFHFFS